MARAALDGILTALWAVEALWARKAIFLSYTTWLIVVATWWALQRFFSALWAVMTSRTFAVSQIVDRIVVASITFGADRAFILPDALLPA